MKRSRTGSPAVEDPVIRLAKRYPQDRIERACARALTYRALS
jgi:hypothetical protein